MTAPALRLEAKAARVALLVAFGSTGLALATYIGRTPAIRDALHASVAQMGRVIFCLSNGSVVGIPICARLVGRHGARLGILAGSMMLTGGLLLTGVGCNQHSLGVVSIALASCGAGLGFGEVAYNVEASALEAAIGRSILPSVHAAFSAGALSGGACAAAAVALNVSAPANLSAVAMLVFVAGIVVGRRVPASTGRVPRTPGRTRDGSQAPRVWSEKRTIFIGLTLLGGAFAEGTANDWLPLASQQGHHVGAAMASGLYSVFALAMMLTRISGGHLVDRFGRAPVLRIMCAVAALGMVLFIFGPNTPAIASGAALWGVGVALMFPLTLSAAGDDPDGAARRVGAVASLGYVAFLVGPAALGTVGQHWGLLHAFLPVVVCVLLAGVTANAVRPIATSGRRTKAHDRSKPAVQSLA